MAGGVNTFGQLGDGTTEDSDVPVRVCAVGQTTAPCTSHLEDIRAVAAGSDDGMALTRDGSVVAWGNNGNGVLGDGTEVDRHIPVRVCAVGQTAPCTRHLEHVRAVSPGGLLSLALKDDGTVVSWGFNGHGELGDGTTNASPVPVRVCAVGQTAPCTKFLTGVRAVSAGLNYNLALLSDGTVVAWGLDDVSQLGNGQQAALESVPVRVCGVGETAPCAHRLDHVREISAGSFSGYALRNDDTAVAWGQNDFGQLGDGTTTLRSAPVEVCAFGETAPCARHLGDVRSISGGGLHALAALGSGGPGSGCRCHPKDMSRKDSSGMSGMSRMSTMSRRPVQPRGSFIAPSAER